MESKIELAIKNAKYRLEKAREERLLIERDIKILIITLDDLQSIEKKI